MSLIRAMLDKLDSEHRGLEKFIIDYCRLYRRGDCWLVRDGNKFCQMDADYQTNPVRPRSVAFIFEATAISEFEAKAYAARYAGFTAHEYLSAIEDEIIRMSKIKEQIIALSVMQRD